MKHFYILIIVFLPNINFGQDDRLFENIWFLTNVTQNNEVFLPPNNSEVQGVMLRFDNDFALMWSTALNTISGNTAFDFNNEYSFLHYLQGTTLLESNLPETQDFETLYFNFFTENFPNNTFTYAIVESNEGMTLTVNSLSGKQAVYNNQFLKSNNFEYNKFQIYPNPAKDNLTLEFNEWEYSKNANIEIYNSMGKLLKKENLSTNLQIVKVDDISSGLYFIKITINEKVIIKKFIKS